MALFFRCVCRLVCLAAALSVVTSTGLAQDPPSASNIAVPHIGLPEDWSTPHVIYTRNGSVEDMMKVRNDPRFLLSYLRHYAREHASQAKEAAASGSGQNSPSESVLQDQAAAGLPQPQSGGPNHFPTAPMKNTKADWNVSLGAEGMAIGESPAKYVFNPSAKATCSSTTSPGDFIVFSTKGTPAAGGQANLIGLNNLYVNSAGTGFCSGTAPTNLFAYAIGSGPSYLSPVLSLDGTKVAWIETSSAGHAILHITIWNSGEGGTPTAAKAVSGTWSNGACAKTNTSCDDPIDYTSLTLSGCTNKVASNTNAELYVDYTSDTGFLSADNGLLYHVKNVFGTVNPGQNPTFDFCIAVNTNATTGMSGAVYDGLLKEVFLTDSTTLYAYSVGASSYTAVATYTFGSGAANVYTGPGPLLDPFNQWIYVFSSSDKNGNTSVTQLPVSLASSSNAPMGKASTNAYNVLFYGAFDNNYFNNGAANAASTLYSCGADTTTTEQDLYALNFNATSGVMNTTPVMGPNKTVNPSGTNGTCSPITEFYDGSKDRIFVGMGEHAAATGSNVVSMFDITNGRPTSTTAPTAQTTEIYIGGPGGIIVDNNDTTDSQADSVYFSTIYTSAASACGNGNYCAVKLTQGALQ